MESYGASSWRRIPRHARRTGAIVMAILVGLLLFLGLFDWSPLTGPIAAFASHALHRKVQIGRCSAHLLRWSPTVSLEQLQIANPSWLPGDTAQVGRITAA